MAGSTGRKISTFIELGGEQAFKKAVSDAARSVQVLNAGMKAATAEFEATGDAQTYLTNKAETLRAKMEEQKKYIDLLNYGMDEYVAMGEKGAKKADEQAIKIANATVALQKMKAELEDVESGEAAFQHEMKQAEAQMGALDASLKALEAEYKATGNATQYFADKNTLLHSRIAQQESIVKGLDDAVRRSASRYGEASAETEQYRAKLATATAKLFDMRRELETADREAEEFGRDSVKVGRQIENGIGDGAEEAQESMKGLIEQMQEDIGSIKGGVTFTIANQVMNTVTGAFNNIQNFVTSNRDYRRKLSYLRSAAEEAGYDWQEIIKLNNEIGAFTGDMDGAAEATANLMRTGLNMDWIGTAINMFEGASTLWQQTLKMENLSESFQETVATGEGTGAFAELVERLGGNLESLKAVLADAKTEEEKAQAALTYISGFGLQNTAEIYKKKNEEMLEAQKAEIELAQAWAELAEELEPIVTGITKAMSYVVNQITDAIERAKKSGILGLIGPGETANSDLYDENGNLNPEVAKTWGYGDEEIKNWNAKNAEKNKKGEAEVEAANEGRKNAEEYALAAEAALAEARPTIDDVIQSWWATDGTDEKKTEAVRKMIDQMKPTTEEIAELTEVFSQIGANIDLIFGTVEENSGTSGSNAGTSFGNGFRAAMGTVVRDAWTYANQINAALASIGSGLGNVPIYGGGYHLNGAAGSGNLNIGLTSNINLNGRRLAQVVDSYQGKRATRLS